MNAARDNAMDRLNGTPYARETSGLTVTRVSETLH